MIKPYDNEGFHVNRRRTEKFEFYSMGNLFSLHSSTKRLALFESTETSGVFVFGWEDFPPYLHPLSHISDVDMMH